MVGSPLEIAGPETVDRARLRELAVTRADPVISVYVPTERAAYQPDLNAGRYKAQLKAVEDQLEGRRDADDLLDPLRRLVTDRHYWLHQLDGLAVVRWDGGLHRYRLPFEVEELAVVADAPHVTPLLPAVSVDGHGYVVALSQKQVRVFRANRTVVSELDVEAAGVPQGLEEVLSDEELSRPELQSHAIERGGTHLFHGHGTGREDEKEQLTRYCRAVDAGVRKLVADDPAPIALVGVDYVQATYRGVSKLGNLLEEGVGGNPDDLALREIHERAWPAIERRLSAPVRAAAEQYRQLVGTGLASADLADVLTSAGMGRVASALVRRGRHRWGRFDLEGLAVEERESRAPGDVDLLDLAVRMTIAAGGEAYLFDLADMPEDADIVAVYRF